MQCLGLNITALSSTSREIEHLPLIAVPSSLSGFCPSLCKMEGSKVMAVAVCALLVLSWAGDVQAACSINQLSQCMGAVTRGTNPSPQCCSQVAAIADFNCFCNMMLSQRNLPQAYINNAIQVPEKCRAQGQKLRNRQCGNVHIP